MMSSFSFSGVFRRRQDKPAIGAGSHHRTPDDLPAIAFGVGDIPRIETAIAVTDRGGNCGADGDRLGELRVDAGLGVDEDRVHGARPGGKVDRSEEHTSELQSLMRNSYAVFCLQKKN